MSKEERKKFEAEKAEALRVEMEKERFVNDKIDSIELGQKSKLI